MSTVIDREYADYRTAAPELGLELGAAPTFGFDIERDWYHHVHGRGTPGRWLVTFAYPSTMRDALPTPDPEQEPQGWLIAYEIDSHDAKTGRMILLAGPWNHVNDQDMLRGCPIGDHGDIDELVRWLSTHT